jgi:hypothetical protein
MSHTENEIDFLKRQLENAELYQLGYKRAKETLRTNQELFDFGEWLLCHDIVFIDNTDKGNIYDYNGIKLTMKDLYEIYLKENKL